MNHTIKYITKLMNNINLNIDNNEIDILTNLFDQMKITSSDNDINELIDKIDSLNIHDDSVELKLISGHTFVFKVYNCGLSSVNNFTPNWVF